MMYKLNYKTLNTYILLQINVNVTWDKLWSWCICMLFNL